MRLSSATKPRGTRSSRGARGEFCRAGRDFFRCSPCSRSRGDDPDCPPLSFLRHIVSGKRRVRANRRSAALRPNFCAPTEEAVCLQLRQTYLSGPISPTAGAIAKLFTADSGKSVRINNVALSRPGGPVTRRCASAQRRRLKSR